MRPVEAEQIALALTLAVERCDKQAFNALWDVERGADEWKQIAGQAIKVLWATELGRVGALRRIRHHAENPSEINPTPEELSRFVEMGGEELIGGKCPHFNNLAEWILWNFHNPGLPGEFLREYLEDHIENLLGEDDDVMTVEEAVSYWPENEDAYRY